MKNILITGGSGFIGSNFIKYLLKNFDDINIFNIDKLTYAGNEDNHNDIRNSATYKFIKSDISNKNLVKELFSKYNFEKIYNFAAETHVDRSISNPDTFIETNIKGTFSLLEASLENYQKNKNFKFIHISTDEVYGSLNFTDRPFTETSRYQPSSPYSASKASSDHIVKSYFTTYGLPAIVTNCSNNFGPYQFPEKLIPLVISKVLNNDPIPVYGDGKNIRDWLYVEDHCEALLQVSEKGIPGESYNIGGGKELSNIDIVKMICSKIDEKINKNTPSQNLITFVKDRAGHDLRYAIDSSKIEKETGWKAKHNFETALSYTIDWYINYFKKQHKVKI